MKDPSGETQYHSDVMVRGVSGSGTHGCRETLFSRTAMRMIAAMMTGLNSKYPTEAVVNIHSETFLYIYFLSK